MYLTSCFIFVPCSDLQIPAWEILCAPVQVYLAPQVLSRTLLLLLMQTEKSIAGRKAQAILKLMVSQAVPKVSILYFHEVQTLCFDTSEVVFMWAWTQVWGFFWRGGVYCLLAIMS